MRNRRAAVEWRIFMGEKETVREPYRMVLEGGQAELVEKKSRFIANVRPVESEAEAVAFIDEMKKKYWDARHNCSAFVIGTKAELTRCSDDGEPSGTAGRPMLEVLLGEGVRNVAVVVTRYFGGVLLGTGGLVRAYSGAVKEGIAASKIGTMRYGVRLKICTDYNGIGRIQYILRQNGLEAEDTVYTGSGGADGAACGRVCARIEKRNYRGNRSEGWHRRGGEAVFRGTGS